MAVNIRQLRKQSDDEYRIHGMLYKKGDFKAMDECEKRWSVIYEQLKPHMGEVLREESADKIQHQWRCYKDYLHYKRLRKAAITLQSIWRMRMAKQIVQNQKKIVEEEKAQKAAIVIQSHWQRFRKQISYKNVRKVIITIQSTWRGKLSRDRAKVRRSILEEKKRVKVEEERRKLAAKQKLLELEENMARRQIRDSRMTWTRTKSLDKTLEGSNHQVTKEDYQLPRQRQHRGRWNPALRSRSNTIYQKMSFLPNLIYIYTHHYPNPIVASTNNMPPLLPPITYHL